MRILIIEDEKPAVDHLVDILSEEMSEASILEPIDTVKDAIQWFQNNKMPDLVFMDIQLADDICFRIFEKVEISCPIIFTTAYDQYALRAFRLNSIGYLLKPVEKTSLKESLEKLRRLTSSDFDSLQHTMLEVGKFKERFMVTRGERIKSIPVESVAYFFGQDKFVYLITHGGEQFLIDDTLTDLENKADPTTFFRINRQYLVSYSAIKEMTIHTRGRVKVELLPPTKETPVVSIERSGSFKNWLDR